MPRPRKNPDSKYPMTLTSADGLFRSVIYESQGRYQVVSGKVEKGAIKVKTPAGSSEADALTIAKAAIKDHEGGNLKAEAVKPRTLAQFRAYWLGRKRHEEGKTRGQPIDKKTYDSHRQILDHLQAQFINGEDPKLTDITKQHVEAAIEHNTKSETTFNDRYTKLGKMFRYMHAQGMTKFNIMDAVNNPGDPRVVIPYAKPIPSTEFLPWIKPDEQARFLAVLDDVWRGRIMAGLLCGLRRDEVAGARWTWVSNLDTDEAEIRIPKRDGGFTLKARTSPRSIPIEGPFLVELRRLRAEGKNPVYLFSPNPAERYPDVSGWSDHVRAFCGKAGVSSVHFHGLRDSYASTLLHARVGLKFVAMLLGDTVQVVEQHYAAVIPADNRDNVRQAFGHLDRLRNAA